MVKPRAVKGDTRLIQAIRNSRGRLLLPLQALVLIATILMVVLLYPYSTSVQSLSLPKVGEVSKETIIAPFTFDIVRSPEELERERKKAVEQVLLVLQYDTANRGEVRKKFIELRDVVNDLSRRNKADSAKNSVVNFLSKEISSSTIKVLIRNPHLVDDALYMAEQALDKGVSSVQIVSSMEKLFQMRSHYNSKFDKYMLYNQDFISLRRGNYETTMRVSDLPVKEIALEDIIKRNKNSRKYDDESLNTLYELLFVYMKPNIQINSALTEVRKGKSC